MRDCWVTAGLVEGDQGGAARRDMFPCLSFPTCERGSAPRVAGGHNGDAAPGASPIPPGAPGSLLLASLHKPSTRGWARTRRAGASLPREGRGGKDGVKLTNAGISLLFFAVIPGTNTLPRPFCLPKDHPPAVSLLMHLLGFMMQ